MTTEDKRPYHERLKEEAFMFAEFRDEYRRAESFSVRIEEKRLGGMITWIGADNEHIWEQYQASKKSNIAFRQWVLFYIVSPGGQSVWEGRVMDIDYIGGTAIIEYFNPSEKIGIQYKKFQLFSLRPKQ